MELTKIHWEKAKEDNESLILQCQMQTLLAETVLKMVEKKLAGFPEEPKKIEKNPIVP